MNKRLRRIITNWKREAGFTRIVQWKYDSTTHILTLFTHSPGYFIGKEGNLYNKYLEILNKDSYTKIVRVEFVETDYYWA